MRLGWTGPANLIYAIYSTMCHQMAQRSIFLFGLQPMYNLAELPITLTGHDSDDLLALRGFIGSPELGWKVAWSDRMVYMYSTVWLAGLAYARVRAHRAIRPLRWYVVLLLMVPMTLDGGSHLLSDITGGLAGGFRYNNQWLATLTGNILPTWFYVGDAFGSFNSWMRLISGVFFGIAVAWFALPYLDRLFQESVLRLRQQLTNPGAVIK